MNVPITDIVELDEIEVRQYLRTEAVEHYAEILDQLPPINLVRLPDGRKVLTDGRHRVAAAKRNGALDIEADIADGTIEDALIAAATANAKHGVPFSTAETKTAALHLWESDQRKNTARRWTTKKIAAAIGAGERQVEHWLDAERTRRELASTGAGTSAATLSDSHLEELASVPAEIRPQLAEKAAEEGWSHRDLRAVAQSIRETAESNGDGPMVNLPAMQAAANKLARHDALANLYAVLKYAGMVKSGADLSMFDDVDADERRRVFNGIEEALATLRKVQSWTTERVS